MWARICECMLGIWMMLSPFIFKHTAADKHFWYNDLSVGLLMIVLSLTSYWHPTRWAHWLLIAVALWLVGFGRFAESPPLPGSLQNDIIIGLLLGMFAIVPNSASHPPRGWRATIDNLPA